MDVLTTCTKRYLRQNPLRTAVTAVGIALSCALLLAVATSALSLARHVVDLEVARSGSYNASVLGATGEELADALQDPRVERLAALEREGFVLVNEANDRSPYLAVEALVPDVATFDDLASLISLTLVEGTWPSDSAQILLPDSLRRAGVLDVAVGERVTFEVGHRTAPETGENLDARQWVLSTYGDDRAETLADLEPRTFTVCGYYADNLTLFTGDGGSATVAGIPALTVAQPLSATRQGDPAPLYRAWFTTPDPLASEALAHELFPGASVHVNTYINMLTSFDFALGVYTALGGVTVLLLVVVVVASVVLIRNSFAISVTERTRQFGLLASIGATPRQIRAMVIREALLIAIMGIPLGVALGYVGTALVLKACGPFVGAALGLEETGELGVVFSLPVVLACVLLAALTTVLSAWGPARRAGRMSPVEAIRASADVRVPKGVRRAGRVLGRVLGVEGAIAAKSFRRAARPRRATVASLVTGTVLVVIAVLLGTYAQTFLSAVLSEAETGYDLRYHFYDGSIDSDATPQEALEVLAASDDVSKSASSLQFAGTSYVRAEEGLDEGMPAGVMNPLLFEVGGDVGEFYTFVVFADDASFAELCRANGLDPQDFLDPANPRAVAVNTLAYTVDGKYARIAPFAGEPFEARVYLEVPVDSLYNDYGGLYGSMAYDTNEGLAQAAYGMHRTSFEVAAFAADPVWWTGVPSAVTYVLPLSSIAEVDPALVDPDAGGAIRTGYWTLVVQSSDPAATEKSMDAHLQVLGLSNTRLYNYASANQSSVALLAAARLFVGAFAVVVTLIAVAGAFNTMYSGIGLRRRELATLRSVGMTRLGLAKMLAAECLVYGLHVLVWSVPLSCLVSWAVRASIQEAVAAAPFVVPWAVLPCALGASLVVAAATACAVRKFDAAAPAPALRAETA